MKRILLAGATGTLGRTVAAELRQRGYHVRALTRRPLPASAPFDDVAVGDLRDARSLRGACDGVDAVFSAAGASLALRLMPGSPTYHQVDAAGNCALLQAALGAGIGRFVYISVYHTHALVDLAYVQAHVAFEKVLRRAPLSSAVIRPTGFFASFRDLLPLARLGVGALIGDGEAQTNPIHEADLAAVCAEALEHVRGVVTVGGPEVFTRRAIFELAFQAVGRRPRFFRVPERLLGLGRSIVTRFDPRMAHLMAFFQAVSHADVVAPPAGSRRLAPYLSEAAHLQSTRRYREPDLLETAMTAENQHRAWRANG